MITEKVSAVLSDQLPETWFTAPPSVEVDDDEILVVGTLPDDADPVAFREASRERRMSIAKGLERRFGRKVSWGVDAGGTRVLFSSLGLPVMTRLRLSERRVLDTLVEGGVARSRSDALAWCVKLVGRHQQEWLAELREALVGVAHVRDGGPDLT